MRYIESIRKRLSPETRTDTDELGVILPTDNTAGDKGRRRQPTGTWPARFTPTSSSSSRSLQIDVIGESQLVGYPTQFPSVSMMNWENNKPNARFWVLKLIKDSFHPGDKLVETKLAGAARTTWQRRPSSHPPATSSAGQQAQSRDRDRAARCRQGQRAHRGSGNRRWARRAA